VVISDGVLPEARDALGPVKLGEVKLSFVPVGSGKRNVAITQFSVRRYPLDRARYEVMLEVQNLGDRDEQVDLSLYGDGVLVDVTTTPSNMGDARSKAKFDVAIYDGVTPALRPGMPALYIDPHGDDGPVKVDEKKPLEEPSFDKLERKHPILRWTAFDNVGI